MKRTFATIYAVLAIFAVSAQTIPVHITVSTPPDSLKLDTTFYKKYINVRGLPICSSMNVPDSVFDVAYITFEALTRMLPLTSRMVTAFTTGSTHVRNSRTMTIHYIIYWPVSSPILTST